MNKVVIDPYKLPTNIETDFEVDVAIPVLQEMRVADIHDVVKHTTPPTKMDGVKSVETKLKPVTVKLVTPEYAMLLILAYDTTGGSKVNTLVLAAQE